MDELKQIEREQAQAALYETIDTLAEAMTRLRKHLALFPEAVRDEALTDFARWYLYVQCGKGE